MGNIPPDGPPLRPASDWFEKFLRDFDQYLGTWVGALLASTIVMAWVEKMFIWRQWNPDTEMYVNVPMFPTPDWWTHPAGIITVLIGACLAKLAAGYFVNSKYNSLPGKSPEVKSELPSSE